MKKEYKDEISSELTFLGIFVYKAFCFGFYIFDKWIIFELSSVFKVTVVFSRSRLEFLNSFVLRREMCLIHNLLGSSQALTGFSPVSDQVC